MTKCDYFMKYKKGDNFITARDKFITTNLYHLISLWPNFINFKTGY